VCVCVIVWFFYGRLGGIPLWILRDLEWEFVCKVRSGLLSIFGDPLLLYRNNVAADILAGHAAKKAQVPPSVSAPILYYFVFSQSVVFHGGRVDCAVVEICSRDLLKEL